MSPPDVVHQLILHRGANNGSGPPWTLIARCSATVTRRPGDPFPANFSSWDSDVTCRECKP